jgi:hypothetical protein
VQQRRREREQERQLARAPKTEKTKSPAAGSTRNEKEAQKIEAKIASLASQRDALENEIAVHSVNGDYKHIAVLNASYAALQKDISEAEAALEKVITDL